MLAQHMIVTNDPPSLRLLYDAFGRGATVPDTRKDVVSAFVPGSLLSMEGEAWRAHRKTLTAAFTPANLRLVAVVANEEVSKLEALWQQAADSGAVVRLDEDLQALTLDIIGRFGFGAQLNAIKKEADPEMKRIVKAIGAILPFCVRIGRMPKPLRPFMFSAQREKKEILDALVPFIQGLIAKGRAELASGGELGSDLLSLLVREGTGRSERDIFDDVLTFILAGHETTSGTLAFAMRALYEHPATLAKLQEEVDALFDVGEHVPHETVAQLKYTEAVAKETLRLHPTAAIVSRTLTRPMTIAGYDLPPGVTVTGNLLGVHTDGAHWERPDEFWPERWTDDFKPGPGTYLPFGGGEKNCIGQRLAMLELKIILARLARSFTWETLPFPQPVEYFSITVSLHPLNARLKRRD